MAPSVPAFGQWYLVTWQHVRHGSPLTTQPAPWDLYDCSEPQGYREQLSDIPFGEVPHCPWSLCYQLHSSCSPLFIFHFPHFCLEYWSSLLQVCLCPLLEMWCPKAMSSSARYYNVVLCSKLALCLVYCGAGGPYPSGHSFNTGHLDMFVSGVLVGHS